MSLGYFGTDRAFPPPPPPPEHDRPDPHAELPRLRSAYRSLRRAMTLTALGYFVLFLLLTGYAPGLMEAELTDGVTLGLVMGLLQFPVTFAALYGYERNARRKVDPLARAIRHADGVQDTREVSAR